MMRKNAGALLGLLLAAGVLAVLGLRTLRTDPEPTNVVWIIVDTTRADHIGSYGYDRSTTPNLDRLARRSTLFEQAYSHSPWTMPSVASMFTSLTPRDHGIVRWAQPLPIQAFTLAEHLRVHGFRTSAFVSHTIFRPEYNYDQGFDDYDHSVLKKGPPAKITSSEEISDRAIAWLEDEQNTRRPFFLWLHYFDPHSQYVHHEGFDFGRTAIGRYDSEIGYTDAHIGRVLQALEELDLWDDTIVLFVADHGEEFQDHGGQQHTKTLYDELVRVPLLVHVPGFEPQRVRTVVSESDLAPTLCDLLDLPIPPQFTGKPFAFDRRSFQVEEHRMVFMETLRRADKRGVRYDRWKLIHDRELGKFELFDLEADPREKRNLFREQAEVAALLRESLEEHYSRKRVVVEDQPIPERLRKQLEALGYLQ